MRLIDLERYSLITGQDIMDVVGAPSDDAYAALAAAQALAEAQARADAQAAMELQDEQAALEADMARAKEAAAAAQAMEQAARSGGGHASVARDGSCRCPKCGTGLKLILAPAPAVRAGTPAGVVVSQPVTTPYPGRRPGGPPRPRPSSTPGGLPSGASPIISGDDEFDVFGALKPGSPMLQPGSPVRSVLPALKAGSAGSCLCACPNCGATLCLSIGPGGYDSRGVAKKIPAAYAAVSRAIHGC